MLAKSLAGSVMRTGGATTSLAGCAMGDPPPLPDGEYLVRGGNHDRYLGGEQ